MEVIIRLDAGHKKGFGHLFRMLILKKALDHRHVTCRFAVKANAVTENLLAQRNVPYLSFDPDLDEEKIVDEVLSLSKNAGLWLFDLLGTEPGWITAVKNFDIPVVSLDDLGAGPQKADLVINPIFGCWKKVRDRFKNFNNVKNGPEYAILDPELSGLSPPPQPGNTIKVGISMGGSDTYGASVALAEALTPLKDKKFQIHFFLGPHFLHHKKFERAMQGFGVSYRIHKAVPDLPRELTQMNAVICSGGQTLFEMLAIGMPVLALANEDHEENTIDHFKKKACIKLGSIHRQINKNRLLHTLEGLKTDYPSFVKMGKNAKKLLSFKGTDKCIKEIRSMRGDMGWI